MAHLVPAQFDHDLHLSAFSWPPPAQIGFTGGVGLPAIGAMTTLDLNADVVFFVGENGSGKSTLMEAIAAVAGINPTGGTKNLRVDSQRTESCLRDHLRLSWRTRQGWGFFLRAETFFTTASGFDETGSKIESGGGWHERSHGEQFMEAALQKFSAGGLHLLDEPGSALSIHGQLKLLRRIYDIVGQGGQFIIATHSPILMAYPGSTIYEFSDEGLQLVDYEDTQPYLLTRTFLDAPQRMLRELFRDDDQLL